MALVDTYERMRRDAALARGRGFRGSWTFLRGGMAAWMRDVAAPPNGQTSSLEADTIASSEALPAGVERDLIDVLANMALGPAEGLRA